jgi:hypothetical protein
MIAGIRAFGRFWYDFVVGDDWRIALGVVVALALTACVALGTGLPSWWITAAAIAVLLPMSIHRVAQRTRANLKER